MLWGFVSRFSLTKQATQSLLDIVRLLLPTDSLLPETVYKFNLFMPKQQIDKINIIADLVETL